MSKRRPGANASGRDTEAMSTDSKHLQPPDPDMGKYGGRNCDGGHQTARVSNLDTLAMSRTRNDRA